MQKIWVNGTFDILHIGHIRLLEHAASLGTLRVGIDTDERVRQKKGDGRPFNSLKERMEFMRSIKFVDSVVWFDSDDTLIKRIKDWEPDILVIGDDYKYHKIIGVEYVPKIEFFDKIEGFSTTNILKNKKTI
jgi:D-beta-D-heptose 7-phosphate kinase/D-beta-D-heptose 1-phosphate adenosyltransferase